MKEKMLKLYKDWNRSQDLSSKKKVIKALGEAVKNPSYFNKVVDMMGQDGEVFASYFEESKSEFSSNIFTAKRKAAQYILEEVELSKPVTELSPENFKLAWEPTAERSNTVASYIEAGTPFGAVTEILRAIVGGDMQIAASLTLASWNDLNIADRNAILNLAKTHSMYNQKSGVKKDGGVTKFYTLDVTEGPIKKKGDMSKNEFMAHAFPFSDPQNTKLYSDDK